MDSKERLREQERRSRRLRVVAVGVTLLLLVAILFVGRWKVERRHRLDAQQLLLEVKARKAREVREDSIRRRQREIDDSIAEARRPVRFGWEVEEMLRKQAKTDGSMTFWRNSPTDWLMTYSRKQGAERQVYMRRFKLYEWTFDEEIAIADGDVSRLVEEGKLEGRWNIVNVVFDEKPEPAPKPKRRPNFSDDYCDDLDGYEDEEDYYYANEDDLRFYYGT